MSPRFTESAKRLSNARKGISNIINNMNDDLSDLEDLSS